MKQLIFRCRKCRKIHKEVYSGCSRCKSNKFDVAFRNNMRKKAIGEEYAMGFA